MTVNRPRYIRIQRGMNVDVYAELRITSTGPHVIISVHDSASRSKDLLRLAKWCEQVAAWLQEHKESKRK